MVPSIELNSARNSIVEGPLNRAKLGLHVIINHPSIVLTTVLLYYCPTVLLCYSATVLLYYCTTVLINYYNFDPGPPNNFDPGPPNNSRQSPEPTRHYYAFWLFGGGGGVY